MIEMLAQDLRYVHLGHDIEVPCRLDRRIIRHVNEISITRHEGCYRVILVGADRTQVNISARAKVGVIEP